MTGVVLFRTFAITVIPALFLASCGGGGGTNSLNSSGGPLEFYSEIMQTEDPHKDLTYISIPRIVPEDDIPQNKSNPNYQDNDGEYSSPAEFDWHHENTFPLDLILFSDTKENPAGSSNPASSSSFTEYDKFLPVSYNDGIVDVHIVGVRNKTEDRSFILFDQFAGLAAGGKMLSGPPSGTQTYRGYNFLRYTSHFDYDTELHMGTFEMKANFNTGTGSIEAISTMHRFSDTWETTLSGNITVDSQKGVFAGRNLSLTELSYTDSIKSDSESTNSSRSNSTQTQGLQLPPSVGDRYQVTEYKAQPVRIQGLFHGVNGQGVSGIYHHYKVKNKQDANGLKQHDEVEEQLFRGAIVGNQNFEFDD